MSNYKGLWISIKSVAIKRLNKALDKVKAFSIYLKHKKKGRKMAREKAIEEIKAERLMYVVRI